MTMGEKALQVFLQNESWRAYYEQAPSEACKKVIEGEFVRSLNRLYSAEYTKEALEAHLSPEDWQYLYDHCAGGPRKAYLAQKVSGEHFP